MESVPSLSWYSQHKEAKGGGFELGYFLDLEWKSETFISSPAPLHISGTGLSFPQTRPEGRREKTKPPQASLPCAPWGAERKQ